MLKKITLCCMIATSSMQAGFTDNLLPKVAYAAGRVAAASAGSYALKRTLTYLIDKLEEDNKISTSNAKRLRAAISINTYILPLIALEASYTDIKHNYFKLTLQQFLNHLVQSSSPLGSSLSVFCFIKRHLNIK